MRRRPVGPRASLRRRANVRWLTRSKLLRAILFLGALSAGPVLELRWLPPSTTSFMLRAECLALIQGHADSRVRYRWVDWKELSPNLALAVLASEDQRFPDHGGFDFSALRYAWKYNQEHRRIRGGSTITQQTAKNLFLYPGRSYLRKALEAYFTALLELLWPKRRILEIYLNVAQFGDGVFGAEAASERYFHKPANALTLDEAALLAAVLPNPRKFKVEQPSHFVKARRDWILRQLKQLGGRDYLESVN